MWTPKEHDIIAVSDNKEIWFPAVYIRTADNGNTEAKCIYNRDSCYWIYKEPFDKHFKEIRCITEKKIHGEERYVMPLIILGVIFFCVIVACCKNFYFL